VDPVRSRDPAGAALASTRSCATLQVSVVSGGHVDPRVSRRARSSTRDANDDGDSDDGFAPNHSGNRPEGRGSWPFFPRSPPATTARAQTRPYPAERFVGLHTRPADSARAIKPPPYSCHPTEMPYCRLPAETQGEDEVVAQASHRSINASNRSVL